MSATMNNFVGCCGAVIWYFANNKAYTPESLQKDIDTLINQSKGYGVANIIITAAQKELYAETFLKNGIKIAWGPIVNPNSKQDLYGYTYNIHNPGKAMIRNPKPLKKRLFSRKSA